MRTFRTLPEAPHAACASPLLFWLALLSLLLLSGADSFTCAADPGPTSLPRMVNGRTGILILVTRSPSDPWAVSAVEGMVRFFQAQVPAISPIIEYMDWQIAGAEEQERRLVDYYGTKFAGKKIRVVIAHGGQAVPFLVKFHDRLFPESQGVFCGISRLEKTQPPWLTGLIEVNDSAGTFRLARSLQPGLRRFVVLEDASNSGHGMQQGILEACAAEAPDVHIELLKTENVHQLFAAVESLPQGSAVLLTRRQQARQFMVELRDRCPVPIYGLRAPLHLPGILGGSLLDGEEYGASAAHLALRLFQGGHAADIPPLENPPHRLVVQYDQMARFGFPLSALPAGTDVLGRPPGFLKTHRDVLVYGGSTMLVLLAGTIALAWSLRQKRASAIALSRSLSTLHATFDSISDGVLVVDKNGKITGFNQRFFEMWGIRRDLETEMRDHTLLRHVLHHLKDPAGFIGRVKSLYANPDECSSDLIEFTDGRVFERDSRPQCDGGRIVGRVWSFRDITARISAEREKHLLLEQLAQSQKMEAVGTLAGGIAHDFNNILTGVIGYAELARARLPGTHPSTEDIGQVLAAGERARHLVRRILTFSRKHKPEQCQVSLKPVVNEILQLLRATTPASIAIHAEFRGDADCVLADTAQIHQALLNLATNAVHAMAGGPGTLDVILDNVAGSQPLAREDARLLTGEWVRLSVSDTGHGMDPATIRRIFEPFYTTKQPGEGTGLGLSVVHGIVIAHGGVITVQSAPGMGSAFHLYFPRAEKPETQTETSAPAIPRGRGERVLVVDDETGVAEVARGFLTGLGYRPMICLSPEHALDEIRRRSHDFAAVLTDLSMPRMTGLDLIRRVHDQRPGMPCVLCTGYVVSASMEKEATQLGVLDVVTKPYSRHDLGRAINRALHGAKAGVNGALS